MMESEKTQEKKSASKSLWRRFPIGMWRFTRRAPFRFVHALVNRWTGALLILLIGADIWMERIGLPGDNRLVAGIVREIGQPIAVRRVRFGVFHGFELVDFSYKEQTKVGEVLVTVQTVKSELRLRELIRHGRIQPEKVLLAGGKCLLSDLNGGPLLTADIHSGWFDWLPGAQMKWALSGSVLGVAVDLDGSVSNLAEALANARGTASRSVAGDPTDDDGRAVMLGRFHRLLEIFRHVGRVSDDSFLRVSITGDCRKWELLDVSMRFNIANLLFNEVVVSKCCGRASGSLQNLSLDDLDIIFSPTERIRGQGMLYGADREFACSLKGRVAAQTVGNFLGKTADMQAKHRMRFPVISFAVDVPRSPLSLEGMKPQFTAALDSPFSVSGVTVHHGEIRGSLEGGVLKIAPFSLDLSENGRETVEGALCYSLSQKEISGECRGKIEWLNRLSLAGLSVQPSVLRRDRGLAEFQLKLEPSPMDWRQWRMTGQFQDRHIRLMRKKCNDLSVSFELAKGRLVVSQLAASLFQIENAIRLSASAELQKIVEKGACDVDFNLLMTGYQPGTNRTGETLSCQGMLQYLGDSGMLSANVRGTCRPDWLHKTLCLEYEWAEDEDLALLKTGDEPVSFTGTLPAVSLGDGDDWKALFRVEGKGVSFDTFQTRDVSCDVCVTSSSVDIEHIHGLLSQGETTDMDIHIQYEPYEFVIRNFSLHGDPLLAQPFIFNQDAKKVYHQIWDEIVWDPEALPTVTIDELVYKDMGAWTMTLRGRVQAEHVSYRKLQAETLDLTVNLSLPELVTICPITLQTLHGPVTGSTEISLQGVPKCTFTMDGMNGSMDPKALLLSIDQDFADVLSAMTFSQQTKLSLVGEAYLSGDPKVTMTGSLKSPFFSWKNFEIKDIDSTWNYTSSGITWNVKKASFLDGELQTSGNYNPVTSSGEILTFVNKVPLASINLIRRKTDKALDGYASGEGHVRLLKGWAGRPLLLEGEGRVAIREAELWNIPALTSLGGLVDAAMLSWLTGYKSRLGKISKLDANVRFMGNSLKVENLYTNGTIMALSGEGTYCWDDQTLAFLVHGVPLKDVSVVSLMLRPLSWIFSAELTGTLGEHHWTLHSGLKKLTDEKLEP